MTIFMLAKAGFGSIESLGDLDTKEFLDLVEFAQIDASIQRYEIEQAKNGANK